ncbi:hypothetical protein HORIV_06560 [Vreelandella olivaria]|uniref:Aminoacyl-transfer RNA synthetases class-II family profile domain-containing protein n=1 Tax=Vreelandella olivaria TaxID=390919 RepID=A0ABM7GCW3_9GAMM|nr:hypothetical protein HORIV_06560 [Halomonas olivaria]
MRRFFEARGFMEVETPMLQPIPGGAAARPFITHHNALDIDMYLRIAPELYLKRLVVGGFEKVFEINRNFRNEGLSTRHNPEFTMVEFYWAYADYRDLLDMTEAMLRTAAEEVLGNAVIEYQGASYDFGKPFARLTLRQAILDHGDGIADSDLDSLEAARATAEKLGIKVKESWGLGKVQTEIFEEVAEHKLDQPTFITEYPAEVSPLARRNDANPFVTDRFEFFVEGAKSPTASRSLTTPKTRPSASVPSPRKKMPATWKRCTTMQITCVRWSTACRPPRAKASVLTAW